LTADAVSRVPDGRVATVGFEPLHHACRICVREIGAEQAQPSRQDDAFACALTSSGTSPSLRFAAKAASWRVYDGIGAISRTVDRGVLSALPRAHGVHLEQGICLIRSERPKWPNRTHTRCRL
jgi:hypothetical protein